MIGRDQGVEVNHLPGRLVTPRHLHPRGPPTDRALRGRLLRKLLEQIRSRHRRLSTSNAIAGNQISVETATGKNSHPLTPVKGIFHPNFSRVSRTNDQCHINWSCSTVYRI